MKWSCFPTVSKMYDMLSNLTSRENPGDLCPSCGRADLGMFYFWPVRNQCDECRRVQSPPVIKLYGTIDTGGNLRALGAQFYSAAFRNIHDSKLLRHSHTPGKSEVNRSRNNSYRT